MKAIQADVALEELENLEASRQDNKELLRQIAELREKIRRNEVSAQPSLPVGIVVGISGDDTG